MADYKSDVLKSKQRARFVTITNDLGVTPSIEFVEEVVTVENDNIISRVPAGVLSENFVATTTEFPLLNPDTGATVGSATYADAYAMLYSLYIFLAKRRDAAGGE